MLKSVTLENFFGFGSSTTIELNKGVSVNVGINGSGKSIFFEGYSVVVRGVVGYKRLRASVFKRLGRI